MTKIQTIVKSIAGLKPVSQVVHKIIELGNDPDSSMADLVAVITHDAATTANILKAANSAYYGRSTPFDSVHQAAVFLGTQEIIDLVLMAGSAENLKKPQKGYGLAEKSLWRYAAASALLARELAVRKDISDPHMVFTAALLKDIGKVVLSQFVADEFARINSLVKEQGLSFREAEKAVLGIDHAELGGMVAKVWQFSPAMADIITYHHQPEQAQRAKQETAIVYTCDILCLMMGISDGTDGLAYRFYRKTIESLGMDDRDLQAIIAGFGQKMEKVEALVA